MDEGSPQVTREFPAEKRPHVGIVGAGVAGLRCADVLIDRGFDVTILEARERVGGRLGQISFFGRLVDLGPNWIHGTDDNPILTLAQETGTIVHAYDEMQKMYDESGNALSDKDSTEYFTTLWEAVGELMQYSMAQKESGSIPADMSLHDALFDTLKKNIGDPATNPKAAFMMKIATLWGTFVGSPLERQSLRFFWLEQCIAGESLFVASTYAKILDRIAKPALSKANILFKHEVHSVATAGHGGDEKKVKVVSKGPDGTDKEHIFDEIVMTTPLGWLKRNKNVFNPAVPERLSQAIDAIGYGNLDKVYVSFPSAWWDPQPDDTAPPPPPPAYSAEVPEPAPLNQEGGATAVSETLPPTRYPILTHWTNPAYAAATNPNGWSQECLNMASLPSGCGHPTLLFYTWGAISTHLGEIVRNAPSQAEADSAILTFFEPYYSRLPNYDPSLSACRPQGAYFTAWTNDPFAGYGSYPNFQVGLERGDEDIEVMRAGLPDWHLWLAGDHTAPFEAMGTASGAYVSGEGVGERIARAYGQEKTAAVPKSGAV